MGRIKAEKRDGGAERRILTGMIVDDAALARISAKWEDRGLFKSSWAGLIGQWCIDYFNKYAQSPGDEISALFEAWAEENKDKETTQLVERFLSSLSDEYESLADESNTDYVVDLASKHFNEVKLSRLAESIKGDLEDGKITKALKRVEKFSFVEVGAMMGTNVLSDEHAIKQAFRRKTRPILRYPGALGTFFNDALERDAFVAFMGPEKRGKTFWLLDIAWNGMLQGCRVAFFEVGDMSEGQIMLRFMTRAAKRPLKPTLPDKPVRFPTSIAHHPDSEFASVEHESFEYDDELHWKDAMRACKKIIDRKKVDTSLLKLACYPNSSITVSGLASTIETWERSGWGTPDIVVVDYADILAPPHGSTDSRDAINATWKGLRRLSQELHCLVVTATQSNADSYERETMGRQNFSEDKRKFAHVTGMVGINSTTTEKAAGLQRLNWLVLREGEFFEDACVHVAGCLAIANPAILSTF